jgi:hypothetical protein
MFAAASLTWLDEFADRRFAATKGQAFLVGLLLLFGVTAFL